VVSFFVAVTTTTDKHNTQHPQQQQRRHTNTTRFVNRVTLSPTERRKLEAAWDMPVVDRYSVILHIFRTRAATAEAKLQVRVAR
jgi:50S ribosomal subunit-associated GTPase HflX